MQNSLMGYRVWPEFSEAARVRMEQEIGSTDPTEMQPAGWGWSAFFDTTFGISWDGAFSDHTAREEDFVIWLDYAQTMRSRGTDEEEGHAQKLIRWLQILKEDGGYIDVYAP